jgi:hypothetical protein
MKNLMLKSERIYNFKISEKSYKKNKKLMEPNIQKIMLNDKTKKKMRLKKNKLK